MWREYMLLAKDCKSSVWTRDYFPDEKTARERANAAYLHGAIIVELYKKARGGYTLIKQVKENSSVAEARHNAYIAQLEAQTNNIPEGTTWKS